MFVKHHMSITFDIKQTRVISWQTFYYINIIENDYTSPAAAAAARPAVLGKKKID